MVDPDGGPADLYAYDDEELDEAPRPGVPIKRIAIIGGSIVGAVLAVSGVIYGPTVVRVLGQSDTKIAAPPKVGSFTLDTSDGAKETAEYIRDAIATAVGFDSSSGLIYRDQSTTVLLVAGTGRMWKPDRSLQSAFDSVSDDKGGVRDLHDVDAGGLGGAMRCGTTKTDDGDLSVCGWADNGSLGIALFPGRTPNDAAKMLLELRSAVEQRG